jgi:altronate dehydratase small subunit
MKKAIQIDESDNVATVTLDVEEGEVVEVLSPAGDVVCTPRVLVHVPFGHKIALVELVEGDEVVKYGEVIGLASAAIAVGGWVHVENVESARVPTSGFGVYGP